MDYKQFLRHFFSFHLIIFFWLNLALAQFVVDPAGPPTALNRARPVEELNIGLIPQWPSQSAVYEAFRRIRDERFLTLPERPGLLRRIAWLYPDSGCFARATIASQKLEEWGFQRPAKLFLFGPLRVFTPQGLNGKADWFYHVAPVVQAEGKVFVLDPAIEQHYPLLFHDWVLRTVRNPSRVQVSVCNTFAYSPYSRCYASGPKDEKDALIDHQRLLRQEWHRLEVLHRNPELELTTNPQF